MYTKILICVVNANYFKNILVYVLQRKQLNGHVPSRRFAKLSFLTWFLKEFMVWQKSFIVSQGLGLLWVTVSPNVA